MLYMLWHVEETAVVIFDGNWRKKSSVLYWYTVYTILGLISISIDVFDSGTIYKCHFSCILVYN